MGRIITILGETGIGKSMSSVVPPDGIIKKDEYNGLNPSTWIHLNMDRKPLPFEDYLQFPKWKEVFNYKSKEGKEVNWFNTRCLKISPDKLTETVKTFYSKESVKNIIIDTLSMAMFTRRMEKERTKGFEKWTEFGILFWELLDNIVEDKRNDLFVWILCHTETSKDREGNVVYQSKVEGNLLDKTLEKLSTNVFFATKIDKKYIFETQSNGTTAKNPPLLFDDVIPNSLRLIEKTLRKE